MRNPWEDWERQLSSCGDPRRLAQDLSDEELVNLLACSPDRDPTTRVLKQEALVRLHRSPRADRGDRTEDVPAGV